MIIIGLTGSIAMGKSEVARVFQQENIPVFDSDAAVHALYDSPKGSALLQTIVPAAATPNGVDRSLLSKIVTEDPAILAKLEPVIHNEIKRQRDQFLEDERKNGAPMVLLDIPLLFETGTEKHIDIIVLVSSPKELQTQRALLRKGMTQQKLDMILSRQLPDSEKRRRADVILENSGTLAELGDKARQLIFKLRQKGQK